MPETPIDTIQTLEKPQDRPVATEQASKQPLSEVERELAKQIDVTAPDTSLRAVADFGENHDVTQTEAQIKAIQAIEAIDFQSTNAVVIADILVYADEVSAKDLDTKLASLRGKRRVGFDISYRDQNLLPNEVLLDNSIVVLLQGGHEDLVKSLISSSPKEIKVLDKKIDGVVSDNSQAEALKLKVKKLHREKQDELRSTLTARGVATEVQEKILNNNEDPDSALQVSEEFWSKFKTYPETARALLLNTPSDISQSAEKLADIYDTGLIRFADMGAFSSLHWLRTRQEQMVHLEALKKTIDMIPEEKPYKNQITKENLAVMLIWTRPSPTPELLQSILTLKPYFEQKFNDVGGLRDTARYISREDPQLYVANLLDSFDRARNLIDSKLVAPSQISASGDPSAFVEVLHALEPLVRKDKTLRDRLHIRRQKNKKPEARLANLASAEIELKNQGLSLTTMDQEDFSAVSEGIAGHQQNGKEIKTFCRDWKIRREFKSKYEVYIQPVLETGDPKSTNKDTRPRFENLPEIQERFKELGIEQGLAAKIFASWDTYRSYNKLRYDDTSKDKNSLPAIKDRLRQSIVDQTDVMIKQVTALTNYSEKYGQAEMRSIIDTFGIYNFSRYTPERLHKQLESWQSGKDSPKNIVVSARADWNGALNKGGDEFSSIFGAEELYFFEANSDTEPAKIAVAVGNRERANGRDPLETNSVENFVIYAHADPSGLLLGVNGERLGVTNYTGDPSNEKEGEEIKRLSVDERRKRVNARMNDYRRHLGNRFRLILKGCKTAGEVLGGGKNIRTAIGEGHNLRVEGSPEKTSGAMIINPDNSVTFRVKNKEGKSEELPSVTYFPPGYNEELSEVA